MPPSAWLYAIVSVVLVSLLSLVGLAVIALPEEKLKKITLTIDRRAGDGQSVRRRDARPASPVVQGIRQQCRPARAGGNLFLLRP